MKYNSKGKGNGTPRTHGMTQTRTYRAWVEMKRRCVAQRIRRGIDPRAAISAPSNRSHKLCA